MPVEQTRLELDFLLCTQKLVQKMQEAAPPELVEAWQVQNDRQEQDGMKALLREALESVLGPRLRRPDEGHAENGRSASGLLLVGQRGTIYNAGNIPAPQRS
jgi:hypothetical protein